MNVWTISAIRFAIDDPSPGSTDQLRSDLETWQVSPGLIGFLATFALVVACVLLFLNLSKHLRQAGHNARVQGIPVPTAESIAFRRSEGSPAGSASVTSSVPSGTGESDAGGDDTEEGTSSSGDSGVGSSESGGSGD